MRDAAELPKVGDADIAAVAALFADPARCAVLLALDDGRALPARHSGRTPPRKGSAQRRCRKGLRSPSLHLPADAVQVSIPISFE